MASPLKAWITWACVVFVADSSLDTPVICRVYTQRLKFAGILHIKASDKFWFDLGKLNRIHFLPCVSVHNAEWFDRNPCRIFWGILVSNYPRTSHHPWQQINVWSQYKRKKLNSFFLRFFQSHILWLLYSAEQHVQKSKEKECFLCWMIFAVLDVHGASFCDKRPNAFKGTTF